MPATLEPIRQSALESSLATLRRTAGYKLPPELDQRLLNLSERKETLSEEERAELMAWVRFTQERSLEKAGAEAALRNLSAAFPEISG